MKKILALIAIAGAAVGYFDYQASAIQVNTAAAVVADSADTPETAVYRDASGNFSASGVTLDSYFVPPFPDVETIDAAGTITANACGGVKRITSVGPQTTNTTNTFTPVSSLTTLPCVMDLINISTNSITLDSNVNYQGLASANVVLTASDTIRVIGISGTGWTNIGGLGAN